jgi:hypothetical protein
MAGSGFRKAADIIFPLIHAQKPFKTKAIALSPVSGIDSFGRVD